jgi:hypothetical protein
MRSPPSVDSHFVILVPSAAFTLVARTWPIGISLIGVCLIFWAFFGCGLVGTPNASPLPGDVQELEAILRFDAKEATQAVAVDESHFYAIANRMIAKYDKETGQPVDRREASEELPLVHLNSGTASRPFEPDF